MNNKLAIQADVAIIGGGPAGCAAALTLRRYTPLSVIILERGDYRPDQIGESLSPATLPLLDYLGVGSAFREAGFSQTLAFSAAWGSPTAQERDFLFTGRGNGWNIDRFRFNAGLAQATVAYGAELHINCKINELIRRENSWRVSVDDSANSYVLSAKFIINATGRNTSSIQRLLGVKPVRQDQLVGVAAYLEPTSETPEPSVLVESIDVGWWYTAPLPDKRLVAVLMSDADIVQSAGLHHIDPWRSALSKAPHTLDRISGRGMHAPHVWPAHSQYTKPYCGQGWAAAGDALVAFDPLSSMGIGYAISSGIQAAHLATADLESNGEDYRLTYIADVDQHLEEYRNLYMRYYLSEQRFSEQPFWKRRHGVLAGKERA